MAGYEYIKDREKNYPPKEINVFSLIHKAHADKKKKE